MLWHNTDDKLLTIIGTSEMADGNLSIATAKLHNKEKVWLLWNAHFLISIHVRGKCSGAVCPIVIKCMCSVFSYLAYSFMTYHFVYMCVNTPTARLFLAGLNAMWVKDMSHAYLLHRLTFPNGWSIGCHIGTARSCSWIFEWTAPRSKYIPVEVCTLTT